MLGSLLRDLGLPSTLLSPLGAHAESVRHEGRRVGLIAPRDLGRVVPRHTADSLLFALVRAPRAGEAWVDVGSGAGFPGLVLACCYPDTRFVLVEPMRRRAGFLELQSARLGLGNVDVAVERAEDVGSRFDVVVARALAAPAGALAVLAGLLRPDGVALLAVGPAVERPPDAEEVLMSRPGVESPGRFLIVRPRGAPWPR